MKRFASPLLVSVFSLAAGSVAAQPTVAEWAASCVQFSLLAPLAAREAKRSSFSRAAPAPHERRISVAEPKFLLDAKGRKFARYQVEARYGDTWHPNYAGCVYQGSGKVYVELGDEFYPVEAVLGEDVEAVSGVCAPQQGEKKS